MTTCTVLLATTGPCGKPAVVAFGEFAECAEHAGPAPRTVAEAPKVKAPRFCRKAACVEEAMGFERVGHLAGTCGR